MKRSRENPDQAVVLLKAIAILLVVLGHIASPLSSIIYSFHVPLFFFIGGFFIDAARDVRPFLVSNAKRLMIPYFLFGLFGFGATWLKNVLLHRPLANLEDSLVGLFYWMDVPHLTHYGFVLWFLPALFWGRILVYGLLRYVDSPKVVWILTLLLCVGTTYLPSTLPFGLDKGIVASTWLAGGYVIYRYHQTAAAGPAFLVWSGLAIAVVIAGVQSLDVASMHLGNLWLTLPFTFSMGATLYLLSKVAAERGYLAQSRLVQLIGANTLLILIAHPYTNNATHILLEHFSHNAWYLEFAVTVLMLLGIAGIKLRFGKARIFKYV